MLLKRATVDGEDEGAAAPRYKIQPHKNRRHPRSRLGHVASQSQEPREQTVGMLIAFPKARRFMKLSEATQKYAARSHGQSVGKSTI